MERQTESDFPPEDYEAHQTAQDAAYAAEYRRWFASLSETDRQRLTLDGLHEPDCNIRAASCGSGGGEIDIALISGRAGRENGERVPTIDAPTPEASDFEQLREMGLSAAQAIAVETWINRRDADRVNAHASDRLARFFSILIPPHSAHKINLHLLGLRSLAALFLANRNGTMTLTSLAERANESKQLLAHHARRLEVALGGFHGMGQKRESARVVYSEAARERWSALTPEERKARRRGEKGIVGSAQSAPPAAQI